MIGRIIQFIKVDIWRIRLKHLPRRKSFFITQLRILLLSLRGFAEDKCQLRASALTFYSLLSIVPVAAMAFGVAKGFGFEKTLEVQLLSRFSEQQEVIARVIEFSQSMLANTRGGMVAGIGVVILFWTVIKVLGNIETSFNDIWGIKKSRALMRKFTDYLSIMLICPILAVFSSSVTVFLTTQIETVMEKVALVGVLSPLIVIFLKILPYGVIWILFTFIYIFLPNTKVRFSSGLAAGIAAGTVYVLVQWAYIAFQVGVAKYNAIYGSFAALPLFLMWLQLSWLIVLLGAEISFAHQNVDTYEFEDDCMKVSHNFKRLLSLQITHSLVKRFSRGDQAATAAELSHTLEIPIRLVRQILFELVEVGIVAETTNGIPNEPAYQPARDIDSLSVKFVVDALDARGTDDLPVMKGPEWNILAATLNGFSAVIEKSPDNKLLKHV